MLYLPLSLVLLLLLLFSTHVGTYSWLGGLQLMACKLTDGSSDVTKLISTYSNMIMEKVRARLS